MPQTISTGYKAFCEAAEREIETLPVEEAVKLAGRDDTVLVDVRDIRELERSTKPVSQAHICPGQEVRVFLCWRFALCSCRADCAAHGPQARCTYPGWIQRLEKDRRADRIGASEDEVIAIRCVA